MRMKRNGRKEEKEWEAWKGKDRVMGRNIKEIGKEYR